MPSRSDRVRVCVYLVYTCVCVLAITVSPCYPRRTSRVSEENKRHVVYTSTDDPIEIARTFSRLNEWADVGRKSNDECEREGEGEGERGGLISPREHGEEVNGLAGWEDRGWIVVQFLLLCYRTLRVYS